MTFFWVNIDYLNANFANLSLDEKKSIIFSLDDIRKKLNCDKVLFSINSMTNIDSIKEFLNDFQTTCTLCGLDFEMGPHFIDEGCFYQETLSGFLELYFRSRTDKIAWFMNRYPKYKIGGLLLIDENIDYEPIILTKYFKEDTPLLFAHQNPNFQSYCNKRLQSVCYEVKSGQFLLNATLGINELVNSKSILNSHKI